MDVGPPCGAVLRSGDAGSASVESADCLCNAAQAGKDSNHTAKLTIPVCNLVGLFVLSE